MHDDSDRLLSRRLRRMWEITDPVPADLADRVLFTLQLEDLEFELLTLQGILETDGVRGLEIASTLTFTCATLSVLVTVAEPASGARRLDGYIFPAAALQVELRGQHGRQREVADVTGRFAFPRTPTGLFRLVFHPTDGATVNLDRPVATPAIRF
jgi:hypothetical protein